MTLLDKLKSWLGLEGSDREEEPVRDVGVTVEREGATPAAETEAAVKGTEPPGSEPESEPEPEAESTGEDELEPESGGKDEPETVAEAPAEPESDTPEPTEEKPEPDEPEQVEDEPDRAEADEASEPAGGDETGGEPEPSVDVTEIKGIGPAYADRLADAGVEDVADLAAADAEELAEATNISATRIENWIEQAKVR